MLIRVSGGHDGIKEYLEHGNKQGREHSRDELDQRLLLTGNLELTNDIIQGMTNDGEKYLHITLSFKEEQVSEELLRTITEEFKEYAMNAFGDDEFNFYAEAHLPKIKSYIDKKTGEDVERKPHIHVVLPKQNLLSGRIIDPLGDYEKNVDFFRAFQERINQQYGLASPADNKRKDFTSLADVISRYKGDSFSGSAKETKSLLYKMVVDKDISSWEGFKETVSSFGEVKIRNEGRSNEYLNLKLPGAAKGINLKDSVFSREAIEKTGVNPAWIEEKISQWKDVRSFELKHIVKASEKVREHYYSLNEAEKKGFLLSRESQFNNKFREAVNERHVRKSIRGNISGRGRGERIEHIHPRQLHHHNNIRGLQQRNTPSITTGTPATLSRRLRSLSELSLVREEKRNMLLLSSNDAAVMEKRGTGRHIHVRRDIPRVEQRKTPLRGRHSSLPKKPREPQLTPLSAVPVLARMKAGNISQAHFAPPVIPAVPVQQKTPLRGRHSSLPKKPREPQLTPLSAVPVLARMKAGNIPLAHSMPVVVPAQSKTPLNNVKVRFRGHLTSLRDMTPQGKQVAPVISSSSLQTVSFRVHSLISGMVETQKQQQLKTDQEKLSFFKEVRLELDATRLLNRLSQSHGLQVDKYSVVVGNDGADRISIGNRNYNVSDFLTKEMNIPWKDASRILSTTYKAQQREEPRDLPLHSRHKALWDEHKEHYKASKDGAWKLQAQSEKERRDLLKAHFKDELSKIKSLPRKERTPARSIVRMEHVARQVSLNTDIKRERDVLKEQFVSPSRHFRDYLAAAAQEGNQDALAELRRQRVQEPVTGNYAVSGNDSEPKLHEMLKFRVEKNGDVSYLAHGQTLFTDKGQSVSFSDPKDSFDREQIELGLRLSLAKFGGVLELTGTDEFKNAVVEAAAKTGMKIDFKDEALNAYLSELGEMAEVGKNVFNRREKDVVPESQTTEPEREKSRGMDIDIEIDPND